MKNFDKKNCRNASFCGIFFQETEIYGKNFNETEIDLQPLWFTVRKECAKMWKFLIHLIGMTFFHFKTKIKIKCGLMVMGSDR